MKKIKLTLVAEFSVILIIFGSLSGLLIFTDVYDETDSRITSTLCLSCIKLDPVDTYGWRLDKHPQDFVVESLEDTGPVFIVYRTDVCEYCDYMEPLIMEIFGIKFEKEDVFSKVVDFNGTPVTFVHINMDHASGQYKSSRNKYDINGDEAVPMFTTITVKYDKGLVKPYYNTVYGILNPDFNDEERKQYLISIIDEAIKFYNENSAGFRAEDY
jgi:thiol-disulfide isomerase/thioredoxin